MYYNFVVSLYKNYKNLNTFIVYVVFLGVALETLQKAEEDLSCLPTLQMEDIDRKIKPEKTEQHTLSKATLVIVSSVK